MLSWIKNLLMNRGGKREAAARVFETAQKLGEWGDHMAAIKLLKDCTAQNPSFAPPYFYLGENFAAIGNATRAADNYRRYLSLEEGDSFGASVKLALMGEEPVPYRLPHDYVRAQSDRIAPAYDSGLVGNLGLEASAAAAGAVFAVRKGPFRRVLDLGCGTGLSGVPFRQASVWMDGIDFSGAMLAEAKKKNVYDGIHHAEMVAFLKDTDTRYDLVIGCDVFIYTGALEEIFSRVAACLKDDGLFVFTVQKTENEPFEMGRDQRFSHAAKYVLDCAGDAGLYTISCEEETLRRDHKKPVPSFVFLCAPHRAGLV